MGDAELQNALAALKAAGRTEASLTSTDPGLSITEFEPSLKSEALPSAPQDPEASTGVKAARAALTAIAGAFGGPEIALALQRNFINEDAQAKETVQQDFKNRMALALQGRSDTQQQLENAQAGQTEKRLQASLDLGRQQEARIAQEQAFQQKQQVFDSMLKLREDQRRQLEASQQDTVKVSREIEFIQAMRQSLNDRIRAIPRPPQTSPDILQVAPRASAMAEEAKKLGNKRADAKQFFTTAAQSIVAERNQAYLDQVNRVTSEFMASPALQTLRDSFQSPLSQAAFDVMLTSLPDPTNNTPGNANVTGAAAKTIVNQDPAAILKGQQELAKQWVAEGRYQTTEAALEALTSQLTSGTEPSAWHIPPPGTFTPGTASTSRVDKVLGFVPPITAGRAVAKAFQRRKGPDGATRNF